MNFFPKDFTEDAIFLNHPRRDVYTKTDQRSKELEMEKEFIAIMLGAFCLTGCAGLKAQKIADQNQINGYWQNPENKVLVTVGAAENLYGFSSMDCDVSTFSYDGQNNNSSFNVPSGPLLKIMDFSESVLALKNTYASASDEERAVLLGLASGTTMSVTCQSKGAGIEATAYFDGKPIAHSITTQYMGVVSILVNPPIAEKISGD